MNLKTVVLFLLGFSLIYAGVNSYVILRLGGLLGIKRTVLFLWIALATFSLPVAVYVERVFPNYFSRIFFALSTLWMGILFFTLCSLLVYEAIRLFYTIPNGGVLIVFVVGALSVISGINAVGISVREVQVPIENLGRDVTIVQLSDIHLGAIRGSRFLKKIIETIDKLDPDIVVITGDMVDASARLHTNMLSDFSKLRAPIYFVTGNHEVYEGTDKVYALFNDTKIRPLRNEVVNLDSIQIIGIEYSQDKGHLRRELEKIKIDRTKPAILMYHSPEGTEEARKAGIKLQLAGHTHNGQIFPFNLVVRLFFKYTKGLYDFVGMYVYVSPGTGTWGPYMRLGSRNEITLLKLVPKQNPLSGSLNLPDDQTLQLPF